MTTSDDQRRAGPHPFRDAERLLARRFLLGPLEEEADGLRRYRARRHESGAPLDVHLLRLDANDVDGNRRYRQGVAAARSLRHSAVQTLVEAGRIDDGHVYALIGARGSHSLAQLLQRGPLPVGMAVHALYEIAGALETLHRRGGSYGVLQAAHVSVTPRAGDVVDVRLVPATWLAAPGFDAGADGLPPEGEDAGSPGDLWQLGMLARAMLAGAKVPASLEQLIHDLLSPEPSRRPRSVYEVAVLLRDQGEGVSEPPAIAPPMMLFTPIPSDGRGTPVPTRLGSAVAFDVIRDAAPPRRPSSVRPTPRRARGGNTPKPRGTPGRVHAASKPEPIPTPVPRQVDQRAPMGPPAGEPRDFEDVTTEVTIVPRITARPAGGGTRMGPFTVGVLVAVTVLAGAALVPLLMRLAS